MKGEKEEEKISSPMFPRLHVNDTDKGGPRAPPRNKMALYEQLCIPSQRFNSSSLFPLSQNALTVSSSLKKGKSHDDGNVLAPFCSSATAAVLVEKVNSRSSDGENPRSREAEFERSTAKNVNFKSANALGSVAECSSLHHDSSNTKNLCHKRVEDDDDDDFMVPTFINSESVLNLNNDTVGTDKRRLTTLNEKNPHLATPVQFSSSCKRILEQTSSDLKSGKLERSNGQKLNDSLVIGEHAKQALSHQEDREKLAESSSFVKSSSDRKPSRSRCLKSCGNDALIAQSESHSKASVSHRSMNAADVCDQTTDGEENRSLEQRDAARNDEMSDTSMVDSVSGLAISPDDVVAVIGPKQFWKARRAIVNQQRVFAIQVFELHRLIKVQKLLASLPHLLLEENSCPIPQKVPIKNLPVESYSKPQPPSIKQKDIPKIPNPKPNPEHQTESTDVSNKAPVQPPRPSTSNNQSNPWCFQPPAHQLLVPVMSPSEGLIYKPYSGPRSPPTTFMTPVLGNYMPNLYSMNLMISNSGIEQTSPLAGPITGPRPNPPIEQNFQSSCNMSSGRPWKGRVTKESELQGSSASSPCEKMQGALPLFSMAPNTESLDKADESNGKEGQGHVIRVTPHNARSATESAVRIFRSIQKEREQLEQ